MRANDLVVDSTFVYDQYDQGAVADPNIPIITGPSAVTSVNAGAGPIIVINGGATGLAFSTGSSTISLAGTLVAANGGTGIASYAVGDIIFASAATTLAKLADVTTGNALISGGVGVAPSYGKIGLTTHVSGILPNVNGGMVKINTAAVAPTVNDDTAAGYSVNSLWTDTVTDTGYMCMDATNGAAIWKQVTA